MIVHVITAVQIKRFPNIFDAGFIPMSMNTKYYAFGRLLMTHEGRWRGPWFLLGCFTNTNKNPTLCPSPQMLKFPPSWLQIRWRQTHHLPTRWLQERLLQSQANQRRTHGHPPNSWWSRIRQRKYWLLNKNLYSFRLSPHHWYNRFTAILQKLKLTASPYDPGVYTGIVNNNDPSSPQAPICAGVYVNDFVFYSTNPRKKMFLKQS